MTSCDLSEIARNSVLQSGFEHSIFKVNWLGENYWKGGVAGNGKYIRSPFWGNIITNNFYQDIKKTNIPDIRVAYREANLSEEWEFLLSRTGRFDNSGTGRPDTPTFANLSRW